MRPAVFERISHAVLIFAAVPLVPACGRGDGASISANETVGKAGSNAGGPDETDSANGNADSSENDMDSNVAQIDTANGTTLGDQRGRNAAVGASRYRHASDQLALRRRSAMAYPSLPHLLSRRTLTGDSF